MALLTEAQRKAELTRKVKAGETPTNPNNMAEFERIKRTLAMQNKVNAGNGLGPGNTSSLNLAAQIGTVSPQTGGIVGAATRAAGVTPPEAPASSAGGSGGLSVQDYIDQLNAARRAATIAALDKSRQNALSNLASERSSIQPRYYDARNQVAAGGQQQARNFAEFMAARGGSRAGSNAQATIAQNMRTQGDLGTLGRQEAQAYTDIERRRSDVNNAYESDVAAANAGIEADRMRALLDQYNTDRGYELDLAGLSGQLPTGGQTLDARRFDSDLSRDNRDFNYKLGRDNVLDSRYDEEFDYRKAQDKFDQDYRAARDQIADERYKQEFDLDVKYRGLDYALRKAEQNNQLASGGGGTSDKALATAAKAENGGKAPGSFQSDPTFKTELNDMLDDPATAIQYLRESEKEIIKEYGLDGFNALFNAIQAELTRRGMVS